MWTDGRAIGFLRGTERVKSLVIRYITIIYHVNYQYPIGSHRTDNRMKSRTLVSRVQPACSQRAAVVGA